MWAARIILPVCLFLSGAAALVYEVVWLRELSLVMGSTAYSLSAVLTAFLGGLALGAVAGGRWLKTRRASLAFYATVEVLIGIAALVMPWAMSALTPVFGATYRWFGEAFLFYNFAQFILCGALLLVPTVLIGMTLPLVTALLLDERHEISVGVGWLYAMNSVGGAFGAGVAGFFLLPELGTSSTTMVAAGANFIVALAATLLRNRAPDPQVSLPVEESGEVSASATVDPRLLLVCYALSGFAALAFEVGWARLVTLSIGSSTYGFTIILVTYIVGISLGSFLVPRLRPLAVPPLYILAALSATIALSTLLSLPYLGTLPIRIARVVGSWGAAESWLFVLQMALVFATVAVPTVAMGGMFPLVAQLLRGSTASSGAAVGRTYAANALGNITGSLVAGFLMLPAFGMRGTIVIAACVSGFVSLLFLAPEAWNRRAGAVAAMVLVVVTVGSAAVWVPAWDRALITGAPFLLGRVISPATRDSDGIADALRRLAGELVDYREGATAVVAVRRDEGGLKLQIGGTGTSEALSFASTQNFIAHLPLLLHGAAKDVLVVGLGSGNTLASALRHPIERADAVEISAEVRDAAREFFAPYTGQAFTDARARIIIGDGRNHLRHSGKSYDVIVSQPSHPWVSGAASLFTSEYFTEIRDHLRPGGVACVWFTAYSEETARSIVRSWTEVFPDSYLFSSTGFVLVGMDQPRRLSASAAAAAMAAPGVRAELAQLRIGRAEDLLGRLMLGPENLRRLGAGAVLNTDDNGYAEFRGMGGMTEYDSLWAAMQFGKPDPPGDLVDGKLATEAETAVFEAGLRRWYDYHLTRMYPVQK